MGNLAYSAIGASSCVQNILLTAGTPTHVDFEDLGIPADAKLLHIAYTPQGQGLFPIEIHGNTPRRNIIPHVLDLWPRPFGGSTSVQSVEVSVLVTWIRYTGNEYTWQSLVDAFEAYGAARYEHLLVPANVTVEFGLRQILSDVYRPVAGRERTENLLDNGATYSHQLNALLPLLINSNGLPPMTDQLRGLLNKLRRLRNEIAHTGTLEDGPLSHDEAAEFLCSALFGFRYLNFIRDRLRDRLFE